MLFCVHAARTSSSKYGRVSIVATYVHGSGGCSAEARSSRGEGNELRPMKNNDHQEPHEGQHLQDTVDMLFDRTDFPRCTRIAQIPERGHFMEKRNMIMTRMTRALISRNLAARIGMPIRQTGADEGSILSPRSFVRYERPGDIDSRQSRQQAIAAMKQPTARGDDPWSDERAADPLHCPRIDASGELAHTGPGVASALQIRFPSAGATGGRPRRLPPPFTRSPRRSASAPLPGRTGRRSYCPLTTEIRSSYFCPLRLFCMCTLQTNGAIVTAPSDLQPLKRVAQSLRIDWRRSPSLRACLRPTPGTALAGVCQRPVRARSLFRGLRKDT
jgi:hypothetical protein